ncbi:ecto-ADP-ribosyltransferase 5 [Trachinotus anak]|uniref:ecto-ADP-ribosyltransferase 5 n=1 Tax=Trachinotus anak TaxID=443729 RepID=UPI0039F1B689
MWDRKKLLLAAIVFTAVCNRLAAQDTRELNMAEDAYDDQYTDCREKAMEKLIKSEVLRHELDLNKEFMDAWNTDSKCSKRMPGGTKEHAVALSAYVNGGEAFLDKFHNQVKAMGVNVNMYENHFDFKSLHFLLMDSIMLQQRNCETMYFLHDGEYSAQLGSEVRLGQFRIAERSFDRLRKFEDLEGTLLFNITSCFFFKLSDNNCTRSTGEEFLLSPAEVFTVESINYRPLDDDTGYTEIVLNHSGEKSFHNCYISRSPADVSNQWLVFMLVALSLFFLNC